MTGILAISEVIFSRRTIHSMHSYLLTLSSGQVTFSAVCQCRRAKFFPRCDLFVQRYLTLN